MDNEFLVEYVSDVNEKYPRVELSKRDEHFAFLDVSALEDKTIVLNFWTEKGRVQVSIEYFKYFLTESENYMQSAFLNVDGTVFDVDDE